MKRIRWSLGQKTAVSVVLAALVTAAVAVIVSYRVYSSTMDAHYQRMTANIVRSAALALDAEAVKGYTETVWEIYEKNLAPEFQSEEEYLEYLGTFSVVEDQGYEELKAQLERLRVANDAQSLYIVRMDKESMTCVYVADPDTSENGCPAGTWDIIYEQNYEAMEHPEDGFPAYITNSEYGWLCSAGAAILDDNGSVIAHVMVDVSMDEIMKDRKDFLVYLCLILAALMAVELFLMYQAASRSVVAPIKALMNAADSYISDRSSQEQERKTAIEALEIHTGDELEHLSDAIKKMERDINNYIENLALVTAEKERIGAELNVARDIQASMLPCIFPAFPGRQEFDIYATMNPAKEVGGDFYDFFMVDERHIAVVMADVSGKGVPAALFMVIGKTLIKDYTQPGSSLGDVFMKVNDLLCENNQEGMFITAFEGVLDLVTGEFVFVNAGHEQPFITDEEGNYRAYETKAGFVLAGLEGIPYQQGSITLKPGDRIFLFTDGVSEATNGQMELYGRGRLEQVLNANRDKEPGELLPIVKADIDGFVGDAPQFDDITMLNMCFYKKMEG